MWKTTFTSGSDRSQKCEIWTATPASLLKLRPNRGSTNKHAKGERAIVTSSCQPEMDAMLYHGDDAYSKGAGLHTHWLVNLLSLHTSLVCTLLELVHLLGLRTSLVCIPSFWESENRVVTGPGQRCNIVRGTMKTQTFLPSVLLFCCRGRKCLHFPDVVLLAGVGVCAQLTVSRRLEAA